MSCCEVHGCSNEAEVYDSMDNKICIEHMEEEIEDGSTEPEDYETIEGETNQMDKNSTEKEWIVENENDVILKYRMGDVFLNNQYMDISEFSATNIEVDLTHKSVTFESKMGESHIYFNIDKNNLRIGDFHI